MDCSRGHREERKKVPLCHTCVIVLIPLSFSVASDDLGDELPGCGVTVSQQGAIVGSTGESITIDLYQARGRGRGWGQVVMGGGGGRRSPKLSLPLSHCSVPITVGAPPQEELRNTLCARLGSCRLWPEEGR